MASVGDQIDEAFLLFDREGSGKLSYDDCKTAIRALGKIGGFPSDEEMKKSLGDPKKVKTVDKAAFVAIMKQRVVDFKASGGVDAFFSSKQNFGTNPFECLDENKSGTLDYAETKNILTAMGDKLSPAAFDALIEECGMKKGDRIEYKKLYEAMKKKIMA